MNKTDIVFKLMHIGVDYEYKTSLNNEVKIYVFDLDLSISLCQDRLYFTHKGCVEEMAMCKDNINYLISEIDKINKSL